MDCPRCERPTDLIRVAGEGGAYREALRAAYRCRPCGLTILDPVTTGDVTKTLGRSMLVRDREDAKQRCPRCPDDLEQLTLSWGPSWVTIEECASCQAIVLDHGELERVRALVSAADDARPVVEAALDPMAQDASRFERLFGWL